VDRDNVTFYLSLEPLKLSSHKRVKGVKNRGAQNFQKSKGHLKIVGARRVTQSKFHNEYPQVLGTTIQNVVAMAT